MPDIFFDFGNADIKFFDGQKGYGYFRHAIAELSESQWRKIVGRSKQPPEGYISIENRYYAVGDKARRYVLREKPRGADRYTQEYYGVALMLAISQLFDNSTRIINLYASHAPRDIDYADDIIRASLGRWNFVTHNGDYSLTIKTVETFDEPLGGFNHAVLTKDGKLLKSNPYSKSTVLVLDVGGYTCDVVAVDPQGVIDDSSLGSTIVGVLDIRKWFEDELRSAYKPEFKGVGEIDERRIEEAMLQGFYKYGKLKLDCKDIGKQAIMSLTNDIIDVMKASGGVANYDVVLLTGGGSALVYDALRRAVQTIDFIMVEPERELMRYANVFGGARMFAMLKRLGVLSNG